MPRYIQLNQNNVVDAVLVSETPPIHDNQYQVDDMSISTGMILSGGAFYPQKVVADTDAQGISVSIGDKVTG